MCPFLLDTYLPLLSVYISVLCQLCVILGSGLAIPIAPIPGHRSFSHCGIFPSYILTLCMGYPNGTLVGENISGLDLYGTGLNYSVLLLFTVSV